MTQAVHFTALAVTVAYFAYSAYTDFKTMEVPIKLSPVIYAIVVLDVLINRSGRQAVIDLFAAGIVFAIFFAMAYFFGSGGGDAILMPIAALEFGPLFTFASIAICGFMIQAAAVVLLVAGKKEILKNKLSSFPLIPPMCVSFIITGVLFFAMERL